MSAISQESLAALPIQFQYMADNIEGNEPNELTDQSENAPVVDRRISGMKLNLSKSNPHIKYKLQILNMLN